MRPSTFLLIAALGLGAASAPAEEAAAAAVPARTMAISADTAAGNPKVAEAMSRGFMLARDDGRGGVEPGPLFALGDIHVTGSGLFNAENLGLSAYAGRPASAERIRALAAQVKGHLLDHGHPFAEAALDFSVREEAARVDLRVDIRPGPGYKYGGTKQAGSRTRPDVLERLALLRYGEDFSEARLRMAVERLARTGYYEAVIPGPLYRDADRNLLYPSLTLTDLKGNRLGGILGYDSEKKGGGGLNGYLDIHLINMRGTARDLDFAFESKSTQEGPQEKEARLAYTEPWILKSSLGAMVDLGISLQDSVYQERNAEVTLFQDMGFHSRYSLHFAQQDNKEFAAGIRSTALSTGLGLRYDTRDRVPGTLQGIRLDVKATGLRRDLGDSSYFLAQTQATAGFWANRGRWVAHALASVGGDWPLMAGSNRGELFELGGANTIRGYREKEFLTNLYGYANLELQFMLAPWSRASLFAVPGLVNRLEGDVHWRRVIGYGIGMEAGGRDWTFGLSYALNPARSIGNGFLHLRIVNNF